MAVTDNSDYLFHLWLVGTSSVIIVLITLAWTYSSNEVAELCKLVLYLGVIWAYRGQTLHYYQFFIRNLSTLQHSMYLASFAWYLQALKFSEVIAVMELKGLAIPSVGIKTWNFIQGARLFCW